MFDFGFSKKVQEWKEIYGLTGSILLVSAATILGILYFIFSNIPLDKLAGWVLGLLILLAVICGLFILTFLGAFILKRKRLNVIAWKGFGEAELRRGFAKRAVLNVLEYVRGVEKVSHLRLEDSWFDVLVADLEFIPRFDSSRLVQLTDDYVRKEVNIEELWHSLVPDLAGSIHHRLGIPVRCGLNAILLNRERAASILSRDEPTSYTFLKAADLTAFPTTPKIGLWDWYLPSLAIFLLAEGIPLNQIFNQDGGRVKQIADQLKLNIDRIQLFRTPELLTDAILSGSVWIVPGGGGWLLPADASKANACKVVVPTEGALLWAECASILVHAEERPLAEQYISYLLEQKTQLEICKRKAYRACPVVPVVFGEITRDMLESSDLKRIFDSNNRIKNNLVFRQLPVHWREWEDAWDDFVREWDKAQQW
jgi:spermidine/putrescine-binding protein